MPHGEEGLRHLLIGGGSGTEAEVRDDARRIDGHEQTLAFVPSQAVGPSDVGGASQPSFAPALGVPDGHRRTVQGLVGTSLGLHHVRQMQGYLLDEAQAVAYRASELGTVGQSGEGIAQAAARVTVEIPFTGKAGPPGEDGEGSTSSLRFRDASGPGCCSFCGRDWRKVVHHDVE
jgi:hypothetical protein